jgi:phage baseplate assembly protein W
VNKEVAAVGAAAEEGALLMRPQYGSGPPLLQDDPATVVTPVVIRIVTDALEQWVRGEPIDFAKVRDAVEAVLRKFLDVALGAPAGAFPK